MATNHVFPFFRQLRSRTSFDGSFPSDDRTDLSLSRENLPSGKRKDVIITFGLVSTLNPMINTRTGASKLSA